MTLGEMENTILAETQQPGVDFGQGYPDWAQLNSPTISQGLIDAFINQGYRKLIEDTEDIEPCLVQVSQLSVAYPANPVTGTTTGWLYPIIPNDGNTYPDVCKVAQIGYAPQGLVYTQWYKRGELFISHDQWLSKSGYGYYQAFSTATLPSYVAIDDTRRNIEIYPASVQAGDTIYTKYIPLPTANAPLCPTLVASGDKTLFGGGNADNAIMSFALSRVWNKLRAPSMALQELSKYEQYKNEFRNAYRRTSHASDLRVDTGSFDSFNIGGDL